MKKKGTEPANPRPEYGGQQPSTGFTPAGGQVGLDGAVDPQNVQGGRVTKPSSHGRSGRQPALSGGERAVVGPPPANVPGGQTPSGHAGVKGPQ
jgi:hypothetical protein